MPKRKIVLINFLIIVTLVSIFFGFKVKAATSPFDTANFQKLSLTIKELQLSNASRQYKSGETISGSFQLNNNTNFYSQDTYFEIVIHRQPLDAETAPVFFLDDTTVYDRIRVTEPINFSPQEQKKINFSYEIPQYFPAGSNYYLQVIVFSSREEVLAADYLKIAVSNAANVEKFILLDSQKSTIFGKDKAYSLQEGPVFEYGSEYKPAADIKQPSGAQITSLENLVKADIFFKTLGGPIEKPRIKLVSYRYGSPLKEIAESVITSADNFADNSAGSIFLNLPLFQEPGAYETFVQFFDGEEKISNPLAIRYITAGDSGLIYDFLVEKKDENNFILNVMLAGPADFFQRNNQNQDILAQVVFSAKEQATDKVCVSKTLDVNLKNAGIVQMPFTLENCSSPYVFSAQLIQSGKSLDQQGITIEKLITPSLNLIIFLAIIIAVLIGVILLFKKLRKGKLPPATGLSIFIFIVALSLLTIVGSAKAADVPGPIVCGEHTSCASCVSSLNSPVCYYQGNRTYTCSDCDASTCDQCTNRNSETNTCTYDIVDQCTDTSCSYRSGSCHYQESLTNKQIWPVTWSRFKFNDTNDTDSSPNKFVYDIKIPPLNQTWHVLDYNISYDYNSSQNYFTVPAGTQSFGIGAIIHAAPNCGNYGTEGSGAITFYIVDQSGSLVKSFSATGLWLTNYGEKNTNLNFNLPLSGLTEGKKYSLIIQDYKLFRGGERDIHYKIFSYVAADFFYGVQVPPPPSPVVDIKARQAGAGDYADGPITITAGKAVDLKWTTQNCNDANNCVCTASSGDWSGNKLNSGGSETTSNLTISKTYTYTIKCVNSGGESTDNVVANVGPPVSCSFSASDNNICINDKTLTWIGTSTPTQGYKALWYGTKNGVQDANGADFDQITNFTLTDGPFLSNAIGNYTRYIKLFDNNNNQVCTTTPVNVVIRDCGFSDLAPQDLAVSGGLTVGSTLTFSAKVKNQGAADATSSQARFCIDNSDCLNSTIGRIGNDYNVPALIKDAVSNTLTSATWTLTAGTHTIYFCVDVGKLVSESSEANNCASQQISPIAPSATTVSGHVKDASNVAMAGVDVMTSCSCAVGPCPSPFSATTNSSGYYTITIPDSVVADTYRCASAFVSASKSSCTFTPNSPSVTLVKGSNVDQDFTGSCGVANQAPVAVASISKDDTNYANSITVTQGVATNIWLAADKPTGAGSSDPNGWTDATNGVSLGGKCEWNSDLNQGTPTFDQTISNPVSPSACNISLGTKTFNDTPGTYTYSVLRITDKPGLVSNIASVSITVQAPPVSTHKACVNSACVSVGGPGSDSCVNDAQCIGVGHKYKCENDNCVQDDINGIYNDSSCNNVCGGGGGGHLECRNNACVAVPGVSGNLCNNNTECVSCPSLDCNSYITNPSQPIIIPQPSASILGSPIPAEIQTEIDGYSNMAKYTVDWLSSDTGACSSCLVTGPNGFNSSTANNSQTFYKSRGNYKYNISCSAGHYCSDHQGNQAPVPGVSSTITINVVQLPQCAFWPDSSAIILPKSTNLNWKCYFADSCSIDQGIGPVALTSNPDGSMGGSKQVRPSSNTTYTLTCSGLDGSRDYQRTVDVGFIPWIREILPRF